MRIAAGVVLIVAAVLNLFAALGYLGGGAAMGGLEGAVEQGIEQSAAENVEWTDEEKAQFQEAMGEVEGSGTMLMAMGVFLLVSVGVLIAGAVFCFMNKNGKFVMIAGVIAILAEVAGILLTTFGILNLIGLVAGVLAIIAAMGMKGPAAPAEAG